MGGEGMNLFNLNHQMAIHTGFMGIYTMEAAHVAAMGLWERGGKVLGAPIHFAIGLREPVRGSSVQRNWIVSKQEGGKLVNGHEMGMREKQTSDYLVMGDKTQNLNRGTSWNFPMDPLSSMYANGWVIVAVVRPNPLINLSSTATFAY